MKQGSAIHKCAAARPDPGAFTTLGYGDIAPRSEIAHNLAILQALVGQLYLVVIMARLVSLAITARERE